MSHPSWVLSCRGADRDGRPYFASDSVAPVVRPVPGRHRDRTGELPLLLPLNNVPPAQFVANGDHGTDTVLFKVTSGRYLLMWTFRGGGKVKPIIS